MKKREAWTITDESRLRSEPCLSRLEGSVYDCLRILRNAYPSPNTPTAMVMSKSTGGSGTDWGEPFVPTVVACNAPTSELWDRLENASDVAGNERMTASSNAEP